MRSLNRGSDSVATRSGKRGDALATYTDAELRAEIWRVEMRLTATTPSKASLRKGLESRLHNLRREEQQRASSR
jgi:hypothetical protein